MRILRQTGCCLPPSRLGIRTMPVRVIFYRRTLHGTAPSARAAGKLSDVFGEGLGGEL
jgi:hypothetical protein